MVDRLSVVGPLLRIHVLVRKQNANHCHFPRTRTRERDISRLHDYSIYENDYWERRALSRLASIVSLILASRRNIERNFPAVQLKPTVYFMVLNKWT